MIKVTEAKKFRAYVDVVKSARNLGKCRPCAHNEGLAEVARIYGETIQGELGMCKCIDERTDHAITRR